MTPEEIRIQELYDALNWIVTHLDHRPGLRQAVNLVTTCERDSLRRVRDHASTEIVKPQGADFLATGFEVALIGRLPNDRVSEEVESYIYAVRTQIEEQAARIKELEAAGKLTQNEHDLIAMLSHACQIISNRQLDIELADLIEEIHELCDRIDPSEAAE